MMTVQSRNVWLIGLLFITPSVAVCGSPHHAQKSSIPHKRLATVKILYRRIKLGMTIAAVDYAVRDLSFRRGAQCDIIAGPEGYHEEVRRYFCSDGTVWLGTEFVSYGKSTENAHVLTANGESVNTGWHFIEGDASAIP